MRRYGGVAVLVVLASLLTRPAARAALHHPDEPMAVPVNAQGVPEPLPFSEFARRRLVLMNAGNPDWPLERPNPNDPQKMVRSDRGVLKDRIDRRLKVPQRTQEENVALAVDLLRFRKADDADGTLAGRQRQGYLGNVTLAHIAAAQPSPSDPKVLDWARAYNLLTIANEETPPKSLPGLTPQQLAWQLKLNNGVLLKLFRLRMEEARSRPTPENELPDAIFPVNFAQVADGALVPAERAKLPPDALATVQQLVLWFPHDTRLYWLLAEVYAARGEFAAAERIMNECVSSLAYSNRKVLMAHREAVVKAAKEKGPTNPEELLPAAGDAPATDPPPEVPFTLGAVWVYFGVVGLVALFALVRKLTKKPPTNNRPRVG
ncbi:tetratricopeptide repeat protein [Gemmata sp. JC717]|uniref:tetratricopeptide repeat protein n=1 Tax=Gemmata algarum TaxID=2975278 RepID=UPI0021BA5E5A|nr:tetratricopeptide repeat protein [Gemmata algarum]MDY3554839.1 tetratricopeptide repeat protein [Gemmata algarum]